MKYIVTTLSLIGAFALNHVEAQDRIELPGASIIGNRELPKVLYIVPWKKPNADMLMGSPVANLVQDALSLIDRDVFRREIEYYDHIERGSTTNPELKK
ncbi:MAG: hypothetical protein ACE5K1_01850 [Acidiferrobacterales bacterium]